MAIRSHADHWLSEGGQDIDEVDAMLFEVGPPLFLIPIEGREGWVEGFEGRCIFHELLPCNSSAGDVRQS